MYIIFKVGINAGKKPPKIPKENAMFESPIWSPIKLIKDLIYPGRFNTIWFLFQYALSQEI